MQRWAQQRCVVSNCVVYAIKNTGFHNEIRCFSNFLRQFNGTKIPVVLVAVLPHPLCNVNKCEKPTFLGKLVFLFYMKSSSFLDILVFSYLCVFR